MAKIVLGLSMSLDGFINDKNGEVEKLYPDFEALHKSELLIESIKDTGAVIMGRKTFSMSDDPDWYADNYEFQVPIFVLSKSKPQKIPKQNDKLQIIFVSDGLESAVNQAKEVAGDKQVTVVGGANIAQQLIRAGLADEIQIDIMPILLCQGLRLFEHLGNQEIHLTKKKILETDVRTELWFSINR